MNLKNLVMWVVIVFLTIGLYNMFKNPQSSITTKNTIIFSEFLSEVDNGRVVKVEIKGNSIKGILSDGSIFTTYSPDDPNLIEKLSNKGVSISAVPLEEKMPSILGVLLSWFPMLLLIAVWIFFMRQMLKNLLCRKSIIYKFIIFRNNFLEWSFTKCINTSNFKFHLTQSGRYIG